MMFQGRFWQWFKNGLTVVLALSLALGFAGRVYTPPQRKPEGSEVPNFILEDMQQAGATLSKAGLAGRGVMLHFWASWCNACKRGMPSIQALHQRFSGPQFQVMGVTDDNKKAAQHYLKTQGFSFPVAWDHGNRLGAHFKVRGIPFTVFLDGRGKVVGDLTGIVSEADGIERIEAILTREDEPTGPKVKVE